MPSTNLLAIHNPDMHFCIEFLCILCWQNSGTTALSNNRADTVGEPITTRQSYGCYFGFSLFLGLQ